MYQIKQLDIYMENGKAEGLDMFDLTRELTVEIGPEKIKRYHYRGVYVGLQMRFGDLD